MSTRPSEPFHTESVWAAQEIEKRTDGRYHIDVYPASQLGKEDGHQPGPHAGQRRHHHLGLELRGARATRRSASPTTPTPSAIAEHLLAYTKSDIFKELAKGYEDKTGHHIVAVSYYGTRQTTSNKPIASCADMQGLKMRVPDVPAYLAMPRACGANTAPIAFAEVYLALQNGTVEAQENPLTTIEAKKFYEVQKHIVLTGHIVDHLNTIISKSLWAKLSEEDRQIFTEVTQEAAARATKKIQAREAELVQFFKDKGLDVVEVNKQEFIDAVHKNVTFEQYGYARRTGTASRRSSRI